ncbi:MAG TPA: alpha/beta fold hydrolase [Mycobacteriales bacterium]|nr:alpha/beta fold hydrolase [Mycobacteriales bacterium]
MTAQTASPDAQTSPSEQAQDLAGGSAGTGSLDALLTDASGSTFRQFLPGRAGLVFTAKLATRPVTVTRRSLALTRELARIAAGRSQLAPTKKDRRFQDPAWTGNPLLRRVMQAYFAAGGTVDQLLDDANLDWREDHRLRFVAENLVAALAPSNNPFLNPAALKAALDTGGRNYLDGGRQFVKDMARKPRIPQMVDSDAFTVGGDLAVTEGQVVLRTPVFELLHYRPRAEQVHTVPVLVVPPMINKYYIADLAPGRSMVQHFLEAGLQVMAISWVNPSEEQRDLGLDDYAGSVLRAMDAVESITGSDRTLLFALCAGGIVTSTTVSHLVATGQQHRVAGLTLGVTVLDQRQNGTIGSLVDAPTAAAAAAQSQSRGYLDGRALAGVFAWLRPDDLVWNYWVNNYLLAKKPPAFDVLFWNADTTRMPARLHGDFLRLATNNSLVTPGKATVLGSPVDLSKVEVDTYNLAGIADHICPWENVYRSGLLFGSAPRFVLSTSGHIAALVNPPGNPKASYRVAQELPEDPDQWLGSATTHSGSWWSDWTAWATARAGDKVEAPTELGDADHPPLGPAPGTYVFVS